MARTGDPDVGTTTLTAPDLREIAETRARDGNTPGGLERVVRMAQAAARLHEAENLADLRPDLADEDPAFQVPKRSLLRTLIRPTGPRWRLSKIGVVRTRTNIGLE